MRNFVKFVWLPILTQYAFHVDIDACAKVVLILYLERKKFVQFADKTFNNLSKHMTPETNKNYLN